eukprot:4250945-Lingulodinium_polyedra.AAC.1
METGTPNEPAPTDFVAVPDTLPSGGDPMKEDHWTQLPGFWARVHVQPRRNAFVPDGTDLGGPRIESLGATRKTY